MFSFLVEKYFFINFIPGIKILGMAHHVVIYFILLLSLFVVWGLKYFEINFFKKHSFQKIIFIVLLIIWFVSGARWFTTEINWLKLDYKNFVNKTLDQKRNNMINKIVKGYNMPENWHDFYLFLQKTKQVLPDQARVFFVPEDPVFTYLAKYYLFSKVEFTSSEKADFIIGFNVSFNNQEGYTIFKKFEKNK